MSQIQLLWIQRVVPAEVACHDPSLVRDNERSTNSEDIVARAGNHFLGPVRLGFAVVIEKCDEGCRCNAHTQFRAADMPRHSSCLMTTAPCARATSLVESVEPSSTTINSSVGRFSRCQGAKAPIDSFSPVE